MKIALAQLSVTDKPADNLAKVLEMMTQARAAHCDMLYTPEVSNGIFATRAAMAQALDVLPAENFVQQVQACAARLRLPVLLGSVAQKEPKSNTGFVNRSYMIDAAGRIGATYDKIHMFDVTLSKQDLYRESDTFSAGQRAVLCQTPLATFGMTICYDVRFAALYRALAQNGAQVLTVPAAFSVPTGKAHWHVLLRARAIETGCFVVAPAQTGQHKGSDRRTFGHSLVIDPWGKVLLDAGPQTGLYMADLDLEQVAQARTRVPSLFKDQKFKMEICQSKE